MLLQDLEVCTAAMPMRLVETTAGPLASCPLSFFCAHGSMFTRARHLATRGLQGSLPRLTARGPTQDS